MIAFTSGLASLPRTVLRTAVRHRSRHFGVRMNSSQENDPVQWGAIAASAVATPVTVWSEYTLATTGRGLPDQYGLIEGLSYLVIVGLVGWSIFTKVKTGSGLPQGPFALLGACEGISYLLIVSGIGAYIYQAAAN
ncbi:hypothetical protein NDN08_002173 [Rhodosorus marinus]|uniref:Uncharacterized protein n=1 Tax=Rhodosorus marinus TaxID=101924 RepID=A0AAV8UXE1_9RHOD|nr:hypothetical protein NDN08_002173 [Rhodosorus marinus]